ncbi:MAG: cation:proton antiporter [Stenomitos frigidus ULC029]
MATFLPQERSQQITEAGTLAHWSLRCVWSHDCDRRHCAGAESTGGVLLTTALLIGASLSATDPVSVIALFRALGVGSRLSVLMEGESLLNDGMAVVAFSFLVALPLGTADLSLQTAVIEFVRVVGIGIVVASLIGFRISYLTQAVLG